MGHSLLHFTALQHIIQIELKDGMDSEKKFMRGLR